MKSKLFLSLSLLAISSFVLPNSLPVFSVEGKSGLAPSYVAKINAKNAVIQKLNQHGVSIMQNATRNSMIAKGAVLAAGIVTGTAALAAGAYYLMSSNTSAESKKAESKKTITSVPTSVVAYKPARRISSYRGV